MKVLQIATFLTVCIVLLSSHVRSQTVVSKADEDRAIERIQQLIQNLEQDRSNPPKVINVGKHHVMTSNA